MISWVITTAALLSPSAPVRPVDAATTQVHSAQDGAAAQNGASFASPRSEAGILQLAARIVEASPALAQIWPGSWPEDQPFVINLPGTGAFLVAAGAAPPGWAPVASERLPPGLRGRTYFRASPIEGESRPFILRFALDDGRTAIFVNADMDAKATAGLLLHEQFHVFQGAAFKGQNRQFVSPAAVTDRVAFAASAELERRILAAALAAPPAEQRQLLRTYFLVRRERESMVPAEAREVERGYERTEGTARYVDRVAQAALFGGEVDRLIVHDLTDTLMDDHGPFVTVWFRDRSYATGAALTHLLSRVQPTGWRTMIEADGDPAALLEARLSPHTNPRRAVSGAKARFGYAQLLRDMRGLIEAGARTEIKTEADFLALGAYPVTIKLPPHVKSQPAMNPTFSAGDISFLTPSTIALRQARSFTMGGGTTEIVVTGRPVLWKAGGDRLLVLLDRAPRIEGREALGEGTYRLNGIRIDDGGLALRLAGPVNVIVEAGRMSVELLPAH